MSKVSASFYALQTEQNKRCQTKPYPIKWVNFANLELYENDEEAEEEVIESWGYSPELECYENDETEELIRHWNNLSIHECHENDEETEEELIGHWNNLSIHECYEEGEVIGYCRDKYFSEEEEVIEGWDNFYDQECYENDKKAEIEEVFERWYNLWHENFEETKGKEEGVVAQVERWINGYSSSQTILLVGEGDFSFSASLAMTFGSASNMTATSLDSREFLSKNYLRAISNIDHLKRKGCTVMHGVDATKMANDPRLKGMTFDRIIFNFPYAGFFKTESRQFQISKHQQLVTRFLGNAKKMIDETCEIHITHKTNGFHYEWNLELLASCLGLELIEAVDFDYTDYPGYATKYGFGGDNNFNCNPSKTYKFRLRDRVYKSVLLPPGWE